MIKMKKQWEQFIKQHPEVEEWLKNRPAHTKRQFAARLQRFCKAIGMTPEQWRSLDKFEARDLAWKYVQDNIKGHPSTANVTLIALKSWYRNKNGEELPFDSNRGGKHYFHIRRQKAALEHIPDKKEMYQIIDMASSLRDKAFLLFLFQTGVRVNVLEHAAYRLVANQLDQDIITLKITANLDYKLRSRDIPFYYTFLNGEGVETLRRYCKLTHKHGKPNDPLFTTRGYRPVSQSYILKVVKMCVKRAGFDPATMWTHTIRKAFRKIVRQTDIDDDDKEQLMGHVIQGSREAYYDKKDIPLITKAYQKCNFTRKLPKSEVSKLQRQLEDSRLQNMLLTRKFENENLRLKTRLNKNENEIAMVLRKLETMEKQSEKTEKTSI